MPGGQPTHSRPLKAKSQVGAYVDQEASQAEGRRRVVFFLRVVDAGQIAAEKSGKSQAGQAKAAMMDAARAAPVEARIAAPAKPAASTPPAAASKK
jgi:hypothetical protein